MDKVVSDRLILWLGILLAIIIFGNITYIRSNHREVYKDSSEESLDYFPNKAMNKVFKNEGKNEYFTHLVDYVFNGKIQIKQIDKNTKMVMVYSIEDEAIRLVFTKELDNKTFGVDYTHDLVPNRDDIIIKAPVREGTKWRDDEGGTYEIIKKDAEVMTPAGAFEAIIIKYTNDDFTVKEYYAKNIGLVKIVINNYEAFELVKYK